VWRTPNAATCPPSTSASASQALRATAKSNAETSTNVASQKPAEQTRCVTTTPATTHAPARRDTLETLTLGVST
jgi:hypothetical protein